MSSNTSSVLKVFKINLLALLAFPLFLISIASKLIVKAMEKFMVFLGVGFAILGLYIFSFIIKNFGGFVEGLLTVIILLFLFGSLVALFIFAPFILGSILAYIFGMVVLVVSTVLNVIFEICHQAYSKLFDVCKSDYEVLSDNNQSKYPTYACVFWHFLRGFNYIIIKLFLFVGTLSIVASVGLAGFSIYYANNIVSKSFGIGIITYLKLFPTIESIFAVLYFLVFLIGSIIIILSLGIEWSEWGRLINLSTQDYKTYTQLQLTGINSDLLIESFEGQKNEQRCQQYIGILNELINGFDDLTQQVEIALNIKHDSSIAYKYNEYASLLNEITKQLSTFNPSNGANLFELYIIPQIENASRLSRDIIKDTLRVINKKSISTEQSSTFDFFEGCSTEEDFKKRYKALCKVYHPDVGGHEETFKILQNQYEEKVKVVNY